MIRFYKSLGGYFEISEPEKGCWVNVVNPSVKEISSLKESFKIPDDIFKDILDIDERPRIEFDDDWSLIIIRVPVQSQNNNVPFYTVPLGIFMTDNHTITICNNENEVLPSHEPSLYRGQYRNVGDTTNFILSLFNKSATIYLRYLKQINQQTSLIEKDLDKSIRNEHLNRLLKMEKCLVYFITSLKGNEIVLLRYKNSRRLVLNEVNEDLLEDATIENKQALEMAEVYSNIQSGMMETFASVISNNLNGVMKQLTSISIILMIPTLIASIYGMNVINYMEHMKYAFPIILVGSAVLAFFGILFFRRREWF
jgi:magnesium transporter